MSSDPLKRRGFSLTSRNRSTEARERRSLSEDQKICLSLERESLARVEILKAARYSIPTSGSTRMYPKPGYSALGKSGTQRLTRPNLKRVPHGMNEYTAWGRALVKRK
jgi:hypothetical protein